MPDATLKDFEELVRKVHMGEFPIMPQSTWGQDAAYLGFLIDGMQGQIRQLIEAAEVAPGEVPPWMKPAAMFFYGDRSPGGLTQYDPDADLEHHTVLYEIVGRVTDA